MRLFTVLAFSIVFLILNPFETTAQDDDPIRKLVADYVEARENEDPQALRQLFTTDADQLVSSGRWRQGLEEMIPGMLQSSGNNPGERSIEVKRTRYPHPDVVIADARYTIMGTDDAPDRNMWSTFIMVRRDGKWLISAIRNMLPAGN